MDRPLAVACCEIHRGTRVLCRRTEIGNKRAMRTCDRLHGNRVADGVDETADGIRAVKERRWTTYHFDTRGARGVQRNAVVPGLAGEITNSLAIFENQHAVPIQTANDGARRAGTERALRHTRLPLQRGTEGRLQLLRELLASKDRCGLVRLERVARRRTNRDYLGVMDFWVQQDVERNEGRGAALISTRRGIRPGAAMTTW